jgi:CHAT domain-containing protein
VLLGDPPYSREQLLDMNAPHGEREAQRGVTSEAEVALGPRRAYDDSLLARLPRLAATRQEVESIAALLPGAVVLLGEAASEQELAKLADSGELARSDLIHLATHAIVDDERPGRSALVLARTAVDRPLQRALAAGRVYDGLLTADEIVAGWRLDAELVVLSACETGLGRRVAGEGYIGFTHAFLEAGAHAVLVSLWPVDDRSTGLLMTRFYENLLGGYDEDRGAGAGAAMAADDALAEAKRHLRGMRYRGRQAYRHPFYWSPFVLIGGATGERPEPSRN